MIASYGQKKGNLMTPFTLEFQSAPSLPLDLVVKMPEHTRVLQSDLKV